MRDPDRSRRNFIRDGVAAGGLALLPWSRASHAQSPPRPLAELGYAQVRFADGPLQRQAEQNHRFVLALDEDALLYPFRKRAGQPAPGTDLGGWYGTYAFAPGATFGQWLSAFARYGAISGDAATRAKVDRLVRGYAATIDARGSFYQHNRFPSYSYDKLVGGLIDALRWTGDANALGTLRATTDAALPYLPAHAVPRNEHAQPGEDFSEHAWDESYTIPENQFLAWRFTGERRHRELAQRFLYDDFFLALARGENALPGKHAYSHVNALSSAAQAYLSLNRPEYLAATRNGFEMMAAQSFATGGWGPDEHFVVPGSGGLGASLEKEHKSFETPCGAYAHFKLTCYLLRITREAKYGDSMERVLYNTVLGAKPIESDGHAFYYSDYTRSARKTFHPDRWPCCSGTLPMIAADYRISMCFTDERGIYVNLYVPGRVNWRQDGRDSALSVQTDYPQASAITLIVNNAAAQTWSLRLRIPAWATGASVRVNGKRWQGGIVTGAFVELRREWRDGDRVELELPLVLRLQAVDAEHPHTVALLAGPLVLMRVLDDAPLPPLSRAALLAAKRDAQDWRVDAHGHTLTLRPFMRIGDEKYSTYQDVADA